MLYTVARSVAYHKETIIKKIQNHGKKTHIKCNLTRTVIKDLITSLLVNSFED